jgi:serine/threonine-protein kinase HipA
MMRAIIKEVATVTARWRDTAEAAGAFEHDDLKRALAL